MPLHADDPVFMRLVLDRFDHPIGSDGSDAQAVTQIPDGLVMRGVDLDVESAVTFREAGSGRELSELAARLDPRGMDGISRNPAEDLLCCVRCRCAIRWRCPGRECRRGRRSGSGSHSIWREQVSQRRRRARELRNRFFSRFGSASCVFSRRRAR